MGYTASSKSPGNSSPAWDAINVTPSDTVDYTQGLAMAFYVGTAGDVTVVTAAGTTTTFYSVPAGVTIPQIHKRVKVSGTTADKITAMFS